MKVRRLGFGAMRLTGEGIWGPPKDPDSALRVLRRSVELGVNFIDTADSYGPDVNEELIAKALAPYPADLVIATKGGWNRPGPNQWTHDASPKHLREAAEGSLKRLRVDRIDVYQLHAPDPVTPLHASMETLAELQAEGKIRFVALSNVTKEHVERARKIVPIVSVQNRYSFADREWDYVVEYCEREGLGFIPWFPLAAGTVAGRVLENIAKKRQKTPHQVALAWLLKRSTCHAAYSRDLLDRTPRGKHSGGLPAIDRRRVSRISQRPRIACFPKLALSPAGVEKPATRGRGQISPSRSYEPFSVSIGHLND